MKVLKKNKMKWELPEIPYQEQLLFIVVFSIVLYGAYSTTDSTSLNIKRGLIAIVIIYIGESILKPYDILFLRPNMAFWRGVLKCVQLYYYILIFLAYQKIEDGRDFFKYFDSSLGVPVPESMHTYADHCEFEWKNILDNLDHYYFVHWFNFIMLELIYRDQIFCWFWSIFTEIIEISLQHILPHFAECWWDHIILDILLSNMPGIIIGYYILKWLKMEDFDLVGKKGKLRIADWDIWKCHRRYGLFLSLNATYLVAFAGGFFVWNGLWVPPNKLWVIRIIVWLMTAILSNQEIYYDNSTWNTPKRRETPISGKMRWNACSLIIVELVIIVKYWKNAGNVTNNSTPAYIWLPWVITFAAAIAFYLYLRFKKDRTTMYGKPELQDSQEKTKKNN